VERGSEEKKLPRTRFRNVQLWGKKRILGPKESRGKEAEPKSRKGGLNPSEYATMRCRDADEQGRRNTKIPY